MGALDVLLAFGLAALAFILIALCAVIRMLRNGPEWPGSSAHDAADDGGEAVSAPTPLAAPASPHLGDEPGCQHFAEFIDADGMCEWCFEPRESCRHRSIEFLFST